MKNIPWSQSKRSAFTLLEVMISVVIISVVILALFEMRGNSNLVFFQIKDKTKANQYLSFFIGQNDFELENKKISMKNLTTDFELDSELRREFSNTKIDIKYIELQSIDMKKYDEGSEMIFEIGSTNIKVKNTSASFMRIKLQ
ncbi:MAG: prepilin-type N-terminal cleavage/methylation domain-containing protein [Sulfurimonas sp.]|nr:prepilin-type N-terminal cleavage/methylation domain-containing protein [Sulfurimonas sp.]